MEKSIVYVSTKKENKFECNFAIVEKSNKSVIIICRDLECVIYDYENFQKDDFDYKYLLLKHYPDEIMAYKDFLKLIGKMCKKSIDSKYYNNHIEEDNRIMFFNDKNEYMMKDSDNEILLLKYNYLKEFIIENKYQFTK